MAKCGNCSTDEEEVVLIKIRHKGKDDYVCVRCLPMYIHGAH